jgi:glycosyltransferase involved in cell wall biosynthesis
MRRADLLLAATQDDQKAIQRIHGREAVLLSEVGTDPHALPRKTESYEGKKALRVIWCGIFVARKALPLALKAVQLAAREIPLELHIVGTGACEKEWKSLAELQGISAICHWHGFLAHDRAMEIIRESDVMLFTSLQEATATVVVEALQFGVPVICHDICGFGSVVTETSGVKVPVKSPSRSSASFAEALIRLAHNPELLHSLSSGALQRAKEISWPNQAGIMLECYQRASNSSSN